MKKTLLIILIALVVLVGFFFLSWSGRLGLKFHNGANDLISQIFYSNHYYGREPEFTLVLNNEDCIGDCTLRDGEVEKLGMLSVRKKTDGCWGGSCNEEAQHKISELEVKENGEYTERVSVLDIKGLSEDDDELMIVVYGTVEEKAIRDFNLYDLVHVKGYRMLSEVPHHSFLRGKKGEYALEKYGCKIQWNATFGWDYNDGNPIIKALMVSNPKGEYPDTFVELWYDGNTAEFIKEENNLGSINPCDIPN